jgi:hypothetical protein
MRQLQHRFAMSTKLEPAPFDPRDGFILTPIVPCCTATVVIWPVPAATCIALLG